MTQHNVQWSVLTKSVGPLNSSEAPSEDQREQLLDRIPGTEKWLQYPPASGRGHAFETRFWVDASDAAAAVDVAMTEIGAAQTTAGLGEWPVVRVHAASLAERAIEYYPGLERRADDMTDWSVMHRSSLPADEAPLDQADRARLLSALVGEDKVIGGAGRLVELRFWIEASDAVSAARNAEQAVAAAMATIGRERWTTIRLQTATVAERRREVYLGVERRLSED